MPEKESEDKMRGGGDFSPSLSSLKDLQTLGTLN
jgi:hypothetical protein